MTTRSFAVFPLGEQRRSPRRVFFFILILVAIGIATYNGLIPWKALFKASSSTVRDEKGAKPVAARSPEPQPPTVAEHDAALARERRQVATYLAERDQALARERQRAATYLADRDAAITREQELATNYLTALERFAAEIPHDPAMARRVCQAALQHADVYHLDATAAKSLLTTLPQPSKIPADAKLRVLAATYNPPTYQVDLVLQSTSGTPLGLSRCDVQVFIGQQPVAAATLTPRSGPRNQPRAGYRLTVLNPNPTVEPLTIHIASLLPVTLQF